MYRISRVTESKVEKESADWLVVGISMSLRVLERMDWSGCGPASESSSWVVVRRMAEEGRRTMFIVSVDEGCFICA